MPGQPCLKLTLEQERRRVHALRGVCDHHAVGTPVAEDGYAGDNGVGGRYAARVELPRNYQHAACVESRNKPKSHQHRSWRVHCHFPAVLVFLALANGVRWVLECRFLARRIVSAKTLCVGRQPSRIRRLFPRSESAPRLHEHFPSSNPFLCSVSPRVISNLNIVDDTGTTQTLMSAPPKRGPGNKGFDILANAIAALAAPSPANAKTR
jgi:hypothetical protein